MPANVSRITRFMIVLAGLTKYVTILGGSIVLAQSPQAIELPRALRDMKPASGVCQRDSFPSSSPDSGARIAPDVADLTCAMTPAELAPLLGNPTTTLVDVRSPLEQGRFRFEGALNATASELATKTFLRDKTLVLVGNGKSERELYVRCAELKKRGFRRVKVLRGGVPAWLLDQGITDNGTQEMPSAAFLTPTELWSETRFEGNLVLVVRNQSSLHAELPLSTLIPDENVSSIRAALETRRKSQKNALLAAVVLVASPGIGMDSLQVLRRAIQPVPLLIYADTREAYLKQLAQQNAIWVAQARGPKKLGCGL